jgi:peptidoglycan/LPS O-acetylase OafA/YrhL
VYDYLNSLDIVHLKQTLPGMFDNNPYKVTVNGSLWTLIFEITCYFVLFIVAFLKLVELEVRVFRWIILACAFCFAYLGSSVIPGNFLWNFMDYGYLIDFGSYFFIGACLFVFSDYVKYSRNLAIGAFVIMILCFQSVNPFNVITHFTIPYLVIYFAFLKGPLNNFSRFGDYSYGFYLYAFPVQQLIVMLTNNAMDPIHFFLSRCWLHQFLHFFPGTLLNLHP